ncbi:MAG: hypothetical protein E4H37_04735 [Gemmatimonadales bacterium]|nr:MAG: hypothetical protein E4H37_04735 [Gemmatimonadales bacterium]
MPQTVEVRFKGTRRDFFVWPAADDPLRLKEGVIVEVDRGRDFGWVSAVGEVALKKCGDGCSGCDIGPKPATDPRPVIRRASQQDITTANELRRIEEDIRRKVIERVRSHNLTMKVSDAEWQWDRRKLSIFFTAEHRVDFRALVRDLAAQFRTRIDLRQIGVRDEAARLTGIGRCGREYCCSTWLPELSPVSLSLAKDQHLALNPSQISGGCGRLLCCLKYEHDFYVTTRKRFPKEGKDLLTERGKERVVAVDIFRERGVPPKRRPRAADRAAGRAPGGNRTRAGTPDGRCRSGGGGGPGSRDVSTSSDRRPVGRADPTPRSSERTPAGTRTAPGQETARLHPGGREQE